MSPHPELARKENREGQQHDAVEEREKERRQQRGHEPRFPEEMKLDDRIARVQFVPHEQRQRPDRHRQQPQMERRPVDRQIADERGQADDEQQATGDVEALRRGFPEFRYRPCAENQADRNERNIDQECDMPVERAREHAADDRTEREADAVRAEQDPQRLALLAFVEGIADDRARHRIQDRATDALHEAEQNQQPELMRDTGEQRRDAEYRQADHQQLLATEIVGERADRHHERGQRHHEYRRDPLRRLDRNREVAADRRKNRVDDREIDAAQEAGDANAGQPDVFSNLARCISHAPSPRFPRARSRARAPAPRIFS
ncbi:hypothetical protein DM39_4895 [Burkholderia cenocepacia]|uniref:Uncharacterized protein n=1 Tax=Burkholderia cenocepacia TaxID=95486 RepID=A0AAN0VPV3_9BURK|nr:hypothetical protein DM39_4895 [Burkholderia cenocepacia]